MNKAIASYGTIIFALLVASAPPAASAQAPNAMNREEAIAVIREMRRIVTPQGVDRSKTIRIGGINQELVGWLRNEFSKDKIFLLGHSWGSFVGLEFARRHPEWLHAYIGVGQATNTPESERRGYAFALAAARRAGNAEAVTQLESIAPYAAPGQPIPLEDIIIERRWSDYFGGVMAYRERQVNGIASRLSPDYSDEDAPRVFEGNNYSQQYLFSVVLGIDLSRITKLGCPLILLEGRHDRTVNSEVAYEWFGRVRAPRKHFVWFEHSGHEVMSEEPGKVLVSLLRYARPIAERAGDAAPEGPSANNTETDRGERP